MKSAGVVGPRAQRRGAPACRAVAGAFQRMYRPRVDANLFGHPLAEHRQTEAKGFPFRAAAQAATIPLQGADRGPGWTGGAYGV